MPNSELLNDYLNAIEKRRIPELQKELAQLKSGQLQIATRKPGAVEWEDLTKKRIDEIEQDIKILRTIHQDTAQKHLTINSCT